jgi:long-chain acyl-CoA synthetase
MPPRPAPPSTDEASFGLIADCIAARASATPLQLAIIADDAILDYAELHALAERAAAAFQRDGLSPGHRVGFCAANSAAHAVVMLGALRAGLVLCPLAVGWPVPVTQRMLEDCDAALLFVDASGAEGAPSWPIVCMDGCAGGEPLSAWLALPGASPRPVSIDAQAPFNIAYSSGTTGRPKGIVQSHAVRWRQVQNMRGWGGAVVMTATPFWANATLSGPLFPALAQGATLVVTRKFDPGRFLELAERHRATHTVLVPAQLQQLLDHPRFDRCDLSSFRLTLVTGAPFPGSLKRRALGRWPGALVELYTLSEGGAGARLDLSLRPDKLHTVGRPVPGADIRLIDKAGREVPVGEVGEIVGRSPMMMTGYHGAPEETAAAEWRDSSGVRFIRTGDLGRFDEEGFLSIVGRKKDLIISGGVNIYPIDIEEVLARNPAVAEAAVVGAPSARWGETPVAFVVPSGQAGEGLGPSLLQWTNARLAKTHWLRQVYLVEALPCNAIGKVLKRDLRRRCAEFDLGLGSE